MKYIEVSSSDSYLDVLKEGKADLVLELDIIADPEWNPVCIIGDSDFYFAVCGQRAVPFEAEVCENLDESIVQHIQRVVCIACIAVADGHQLLGIAPIEHLSGSIFSCPTPSYQLLLLFQINHLFLRGFSTPYCLLDDATA